MVSRPVAVVSIRPPLLVPRCHNADSLGWKVLHYRSLESHPGDTARGRVTGAVSCGGARPDLPCALYTTLIPLHAELVLASIVPYPDHFRFLRTSERLSTCAMHALP